MFSVNISLQELMTEAISFAFPIFIRHFAPTPTALQRVDSFIRTSNPKPFVCQSRDQQDVNSSDISEVHCWNLPALSQR